MNRTSPSARTPRFTVLVVDDNPDDCAVLAGALTGAGHQAMVVGHARGAMELARRIPFDLALVDYCLPEMHGTLMVRALHSAGLRLPFILLTAFSTTGVVVEAMREGAYAVIDKPVPLDRLSALVTEAVRAARAGQAAPGVRHDARDPAGQGAPDSGVDRLARLIVVACHSHRELRTLAECARAAGVSRTTLADACQLLDLRPHAVRDFIRVLRAVLRREAGLDRTTPMLFGALDRRTVRRLLTRAGLGDRSIAFPTVSQFLTQQQFVDGRHQMIDRVRRRLLPSG